MIRYPLIAPNPPRLSAHPEVLRRIEASGTYSNNGPELRAFEAEATARLFGGEGACLGVANATLGLMLALRRAAGGVPRQGALAIVPALTFAATAQAAEWAGLTPLVADVDPEAWALCPAATDRLLARHAGKVAAVVPYAAFGAPLDFSVHLALAERHGAALVVDAASSLGALDAAGRGYGAGAPHATVYSMHATKPFAVGEGGLVHSADAALIEELRTMAGFGFGQPRVATVAGLNAKLAELPAAVARLKLARIDAVAERRAELEAAYRDALAGFGLQRASGCRHAPGFMPLLLPPNLAGRRDEVCAALEARGIASGAYFSPHLGEQPWFRDHALLDATPVADGLSARLLSLPLTDTMAPADATHIAQVLAGICERLGRRRAGRVRPAVARTLLVGGGPAGTALLAAAAKDGRLSALAAGLVIAERGGAIGGGRLGDYAISSDSTAQTFLSAVEGSPEPALAALADHPAARAVARRRDALGAPLAEVGPLLRAMGDRLEALVRDGGGAVLSGHEALDARRMPDGLWHTRLRRADGQHVAQVSETLVIATGGHQPLDRLAAQRVAGAPLAALAGDRLVQSDEVLACGGMARVADLLAGRRDPRVAVIGGSTSALASVSLLLRAVPALPLGEGAVTLLHRRPLQPFYPSAEAALADGFTDWGPADICPVSGFVYRLGGFRLEARELVLRMRGIGGRRPEPRVRLHRLREGEDPAAQAALRDADLVIAALGYRPRALPLLGADGRRIALAADDGRPMVDRHCRVLCADGAPLPGVWGIGLAAGFVPWGTMGGEPSFAGQANGLWLWQNDVGAEILGQLPGLADEGADADWGGWPGVRAVA